LFKKLINYLILMCRGSGATTVLADRAACYTVWSAIGIILSSVRTPSVCLSVTL